MSNPQIADQQITSNQVQNLKSAERIVDFFDMLGYPVDDRIEMTPEALNFSDDLSESVQRIEKISSVDEMLEVYLVEMISVTVARRKALARSFRDFPMEFLFVLTDDYKRIDFMLLERKIPTYKEFGIGKRKALIHQHAFSVDRSDPDRIALRVLRRLSFTAYDQQAERDPLGQYDKLKSAFTTARWSEPYFNNRALFSDYYLTERIPEHPFWEAEDRHQSFRAIRDVYASAGSLAGKDHHSLRGELIAPVMKELGFFVESLDSQEGPDLNLFGEAGASGEQLAFALCYPWNRYLDGRDAGGTDPERGHENPGAVMVGLLEEGTASWGILTNGKIWRLYSAEAHSRATNYYEIDLEETLASPDPGKAFRYFYLFFQAESFIPEEQNLSGETRELSFLDLVLEESDLYARQLGDRLKDTVFEKVFPNFAEGFIEGMGGTEALLELTEEEREEKLELVFRGTLTFLYRLLFLFYAESRNLLPVREVRGYYKKSLQRIKEDIAARAGDIEELAPGNIREAFGKTEKDLYERFSKLCEIVDEGSPAINVPVYNGGLFLTDSGRARSQRDKEISRFLLEYPIPDQYFALGLDKMARDIDPKKHSLGFIDYKSLGVRQLGSIYEGLLEFKISVAAEEMTVVEGRQTEEIVPYKEAKKEGLKILVEGRGQNSQERAIPRGEIYLVNDKRERKATGSYYTPDYIVKYIVEHAVGPALDEKLEELKPRLQETEQKYRALLNRKREFEGVEPDPYRLLKVNFGEVILELFDIKVLDPAMGSGHFLVEAVDYITDRLVRFLDRYPFLSVFFEGMKETILNELSDQGVAADPELLTDVNLLKRHVLKRCIYGVDLNPMAVELAKVSLWLDCFTLGAPLSFLDHHLKYGNSLIGAMARELDEGDDDQQMTFLTGPFAGLLRAAEIMRGVSLLTDVTLNQVQESGELYREYEEKAKPFKELLDIYISQHFGVELAEELLTVHDQDEALQMIKGEIDYPDVYTDVVEKAQSLNKQNAFFHWDLEFPEVFIDLENTKWKQKGGFDAVVGNPPYVRWHEIGKYRKYFEDGKYFDCEYSCRPNHADAQPNLYLFFSLLTHEVMNYDGFGCLIIPHEWLDDEKAKDISDYLYQHIANGSLLIFDPKYRVFNETDGTIGTTSLVFGISKNSNYYSRNKVDSVLIESKEKSEIISLLDKVDLWDLETVSNKQEAINYAFIEHAKHKEYSWNTWLFEDISKFIKLISLREDIVVETGNDDLFTIGGGFQPPMNYVHFYTLTSSQLTKIPREEKDFIFPAIVNASSMKRYFISDEDRYWIVLNSLTSFNRVQKNAPNILKYLERNKEILKDSFGKDWWKFPNIRNFDFFRKRKTKLISPRTSNRNSFSFDDKGYVFKGTNSFIHISSPYSQLFLLAVLNSKFLDVYFGKIGKGYHGVSRKYEPGKIDHFPIRRINFNTPNKERELICKKLINLYNNGKDIIPLVYTLIPNILMKSTSLPKRDYSENEEKSDVIHDFLAYLAKQMSQIQEEKHVLIKSFLEGFGSVVDSGNFSELKATGKWESSLAKHPACLPYVDPESSSSKYIDDTLDWDEKAFRAFAGILIGKTSVIPAMVEVYRKYAPEYQDISQRIEETDDLIDRIVYRLYGLAEEEIEIVESSFED